MSNEERPECTDCGKESPPAESTYTLISARHGWRLTIERDDSGTRTCEWRCPECWKAFKDRKPKSSP